MLFLLFVTIYLTKCLSLYMSRKITCFLYFFNILINYTRFIIDLLSLFLTLAS
jgi:hypothetical protein